MKVAYVILAYVVLSTLLFMGGCKIGEKIKENQYLKASVEFQKKGSEIEDQFNKIDDYSGYNVKCD